MFEHASTSYLFFDAQHGVTHCNPATLRMFGTSDPHLLLGRIPWFPGLSTDLQADGKPSREHALEDLREHTRTGQRVRTFEWRFRRVDGRAFDAEVSVIALEWAGTPEFCAVIQDITTRKQMLAATEQAREAAEAASQTKSSFLANMSHELRTPMNAIIGMTHLALEDGLPDKQRDYIEKAHGSARNLLQILNDILDVSKIEAGQMALERIDFELESVVGEMADVLGLKADEKGLELLFSAAPDLPRRLVGDPTRLRQVLVNLGGNAIKFTETGEVTVGMEVTDQQLDTIELHAWVRDTGVGMSEEEVGRLFQPFVQADASTTRRYGGTGLGLVISRQLVERMGGKIWVESAPGQGSTFHFSARFGRSAPRAPARAWMANELRGRRALLVDDNAAALDVLGGMLESLGVSVDRADSGERALAMIATATQTYTWFLIDWKMPGMDGVECARRIVAEHPTLEPCIVLVTGFRPRRRAAGERRRGAGWRAAQAGHALEPARLPGPGAPAGTGRTGRGPPRARRRAAAAGGAATPDRHARPARRGPSAEPATRLRTAAPRRGRGGGREGRPGSAGQARTGRSIRRRADGLPDAGDGRLHRHPRIAQEPGLAASAGDRDDRQRAGRGPRPRTRERHERAHHQAHPHRDDAAHDGAVDLQARGTAEASEAGADSSPGRRSRRGPGPQPPAWPSAWATKSFTDVCSPASWTAKPISSPKCARPSPNSAGPMRCGAPTT